MPKREYDGHGGVHIDRVEITIDAGTQSPQAIAREVRRQLREVGRTADSNVRRGAR